MFCNYPFTLQIEDGEIFATINQKDGMVSFHDNPEKYNNASMLLQLDAEVSVILIQLLANIGQFNCIF